jgi:ribosomal protein S14
VRRARGKVRVEHLDHITRKLELDRLAGLGLGFFDEKEDALGVGPLDMLVQVDRGEVLDAERAGQQDRRGESILARQKVVVTAAFAQRVRIRTRRAFPCKTGGRNGGRLLSDGFSICRLKILPHPQAVIRIAVCKLSPCKRRACAPVKGPCDLPVYDSAAKYDSGTGWPSFFRSLPDAVRTKEDRKFIFQVRTEVHCRRCGSHLGHIFDDGPAPTGKRHCLNGLSLTFEPAV